MMLVFEVAVHLFLTVATPAQLARAVIAVRKSALLGNVLLSQCDQQAVLIAVVETVH